MFYTFILNYISAKFQQAIYSVDWSEFTLGFQFDGYDEYLVLQDNRFKSSLSNLSIYPDPTFSKFKDKNGQDVLVSCSGSYR